MKLVLILAGVLAALFVASCAGNRTAAPPSRAALSGEVVYRDQCAHCHGPAGEGVAGKNDEPLYGERSVESLTSYIARTMPKDRKKKCAPAEAAAVAGFIHGAFYSAEARARNRPPRIEFARLTNRQYRETVADLLGSFRPVKLATRGGGLRAEYFQSNGMNKKEKKVIEREDRAVEFDFGEGSPAEGITADQFSIAWNGSLLARDTGMHEFRLTTPNGARLYFNTDLAAGDSNHRDDSDARRQPALIELWVSSGGMVREAVAQVFLLGGRSYPLRLDYFKFKEKTAAVKLEWKPPHGVWQVVPAAALSPEPSSLVSVVSTAFPPDDGSAGYERGTSISKAWHEATTKAAVEMAAHVEARLDLLAGVSEGASNRVEKLRDFCGVFAERAFRRPLTPELHAACVDRFFARDTAPEAAVKRAVLFILSSPEFLYPELPGPVDDHRLAARLALAMWDSLPDAAAREAAARGEVHTDAQLRAQAERMLAEPSARAKLREFFHHWLAIQDAEDITKDPQAFPDFNPAIVADLRASLERFVEHVVGSERADYRELLTADYLFLNDRLGKFYGAAVAEESDFVPVNFDPRERAGVFTHPFLLAAFSYHKSTSPIHRGVFLTRHVLGRFLKPPPMAIEFMDDRFDPSLTMREKVTQLTSKEACMACHVTINPLGFSLENYDAVGRRRSVDNQKPVNAESDYTTSDGRVIRLRGPRDLAEHAVTSGEARRGFVRQLFQQTVKQPVAAYGTNVLDRLDDGFVRTECHIRKLLVEIVVTAAQPGAGFQLAATP